MKGGGPTGWSGSRDPALGGSAGVIAAVRDPIRCYYKTHVQNSKKRLNTLLGDPLKPKNRDALIRIIKEVGEHVAKRRWGSGRRGVGTNGVAAAAMRRLEELKSGGPPPAPRLEPTAIAPVGGGAQDQSTLDRAREERTSWSPRPNRQRPHLPPSPCMFDDNDACHLGRGCAPADDAGTAPPFPSPCRPEHAGMLQSIRQSFLGHL